MILFLSLVTVFVIAMIAATRSKRLEQKVERLEFVVNRLQAQLTPPPPPVEPDVQESTPANVAPEETTTGDVPQSGAIESPPETIPAQAATPGTGFALFRHIQENWMIWIGGLCVALAGIFLARYALEQGLIGPRTRIAMGIATGLALHATAEWLRRRTGESHPSLAALAGGGSITLFAILLAALHLYGLISPTLAFTLLAVVALATMVLAYLHGPALAAVGILGAYTVPIFISTGSSSITIALIYSLIVSASALLLLRYVFRKWLWWGVVAGALFWWLVSLDYHYLAVAQGWYLMVFTYFLLAIPGFNWLLNQPFTLSRPDSRNLLLTIDDDPDGREQHLRVAVSLIILALGMSIFVQHPSAYRFAAWGPLLILLLVACRTRESLAAMPWLVVLVQLIAYTLPRISLGHEPTVFIPLSNSQALELAKYSGLASIVVVVLGIMNLRGSRFKSIWSSLITLTPLLFLTLVYLLSDDVISRLQWALYSAALAILYLALAGLHLKRQSNRALLVWLFFCGHFAASLAAVIMTQDGRLTLAFALQLISIGWIIRQFDLPELGWMLKLLVAIVIARLTFNPWLANYSPDAHWSLYTYGGATLCCVAAMRLVRSWTELAKWTEAAALHLFTLFLWTELRYWLYDGEVFATEFTLLEASLMMGLFGSLSIIYYRRGLVSENLRVIYQIFSRILLLLAGVLYYAILVAVLLEASWAWQSVDSRPVFNILLLSFGAPVLLGLLTRYLHEPALGKAALGFAGFAAFVFVNLEIKHLWQGSIQLYAPMGSAELYTYSAVWLVVAVLLVLGSTLQRTNSDMALYKAGMGLLGLVIAKLFLVDMSGLDGLLRVASFMGLGLSLLGLSFLHQRMQTTLQEESTE